MLGGEPLLRSVQVFPPRSAMRVNVRLLHPSRSKRSGPAHPYLHNYLHSLRSNTLLYDLQGPTTLHQSSFHSDSNVSATAHKSIGLQAVVCGSCYGVGFTLRVWVLVHSTSAVGHATFIALSSHHRHSELSHALILPTATNPTFGIAKKDS